MDLDYYLDPYVSRKEIISRWDSYLVSQGKIPNLINKEKLAKEISEKYKISRESIQSLFNTTKFDISEVKEEQIWKYNSELPDISSLRKFNIDHSQTFLDELEKRINMPDNEDISVFGPNNADSIAEKEWCHENKFYDGEYNHGMCKCECFHKIPTENFTECVGCKDIIYASENQWVRTPLAETFSGGWGEFYCSKNCMNAFLQLNVVEEIITELVRL